MNLFGFTTIELVELWPYGLEFYRSLRDLIEARKAKGFTPYQTMKMALENATDWQRARAIDAPLGPTAAEQAAFDRASGGSG